ncbi:uncharacterized protein [Porites lutea]|uniref:uncharacterized protein n=1 Tax=Porites lutea TaxID=51062 RepID=UPI003CC6C341
MISLQVVRALDSSCYQLCLKKIKATRRQQFLAFAHSRKKRIRKERSPATKCPTSSPSQNVNWYPSEVNVSFGKYENTNQWFSNLSWTLMNDTHGNWTAVLVRFAVSHKTAIAPDLTCFLYLKNQSDLTLNISSYGFRYPDYLFLLQISGFPFTQDALSDMETYEPNLSTTTTHPPGSSTKEKTATYPSRSTSFSKYVFTTPPSISTKRPQSPTTKEKDPNHTTVVYAVSISLGIVVGMVLVCLVTSRKYSCLRQRKTILLPEEFEYHAFIIYNKEDSSWVVRKLLPLLEDKHHLKCCVHYRDFEPGKPFHDIMAETVYKSYKIIAVLSSNFLKSNYCNYELNLAKYRLVHRADNSLIMIRIDDADSKKLPRTLRKRNFIDYCNVLERPFWEEKLLRFLDVQNEDRDNRSAIAVQNQDVDNNEAEGSAFPSFNSIELRKNFNRLNSTTSNKTEVSLVSLPNEELNLEV